VSVLTPTAELHVPATVYALTRWGIPVERATAAVASKTMFMIMWICAVAFAALLLDPAVSLPAEIRAYVPLYAIPLIFIVAFYASIVLGGRRIHAWARERLKDRAMGRWKRRFVHGLDRSAGAMAQISGVWDLRHLAAHAASLAYLLTYCLIGYILSRAVGYELTFPHAISIFSISLMVAYLSPIPGSIGVTELATGFLLEQQLTERALLVAITLRVLTLYIVLLPGALVALNIARKDGLAYLHKGA
jgi:uncharacterized protein (TIRG00374 family)